MSRRFAALSGLAAALAVSAASPAGAQDDESWGEGDDDAGFADEEVTAPAVVEEASPITVAGFARTDEALWLERMGERPLAKARQSLDLALDYKGRRSRLRLAGHGEIDLAWLIDSDEQDVPSREVYERDLQLREAFLGIELESIDLTVGRQIVAWGEGDALSPVDVINPRDLREPGLADLDDIRMPVLASRLGWFRGDHRVELMVVHEPHWGLRSPPFGEFSPLPALLEDGAGAADALARFAGKELRLAHRPDEGLPSFAADEQGWFARWVYKGDAADVGLYAASLLHQQGVFAMPDIRPADLLPGGSLDLPVRHDRYTMLGHSGAATSGSWLVKWEAALDLDRPVNVLLDPTASVAAAAAVQAAGSPLSDGTLDALTPALVVTYTGLSDASVTLEVQRSVVLSDPAHVEDGLGTLAFDPETPVIALRSSHNFLREDLNVALAATLFGAEAEQGWLARGELSYKLCDGWKATLGYITYQPGDELGLLSGLDRHDRLFTKLRWDFQLL